MSVEKYNPSTDHIDPRVAYPQYETEDHPHPEERTATEPDLEEDDK